VNNEMADITVRAPDGSIVEVPEDQYQTALNAGYQNVSAEEAQAAREQYAAGLTDTEALRQGVIEAEPGYSVAQAAAQKTLSAATFGQYPGLDRPEEVAVGQRFAAEHPVAAFGAELVGQLPLAVGLGAAGAAAAGGVAGAGLAARAGVAAADFGVQAAVGGAQTEAELARLELRDFNPTNAAVVGVFGEALGRSAAYGFSKGLGFSRNLLARGEQRAVAQDSADSLGRGGLLNDFRVAAHAETYQNELSKLAADDLDRLEDAFAEVGRQDRKRLRVARLIEDLPEPQAGVRVELVGAYQKLYDGLLAEVGEGGAPAPARRLLDQLRGRIDALSGGDAPVGRKLWRQLDENRQALQEYAGDLHTSYENAPGSAWLSRDGLRLLDDATRQTREALLREDAWGAAAAREQAAYNVPFTEKFFPNDKTVKGKLFFQSGNNERGFPKFRGDPGRVRQLFRRAADDVDATRLDEQFGDWLDGVEAIARAGERDVPAAASEALEAIRRLRKARSHAQFVQSVSERVSRRADAAEVIIGAGAGLALAGPAGAVFGGAAGQAARGLRLANWLARAARRVGWAGSPQSMADLLGRGALPARQGPNVPTQLTDDVLDSAPPTPGGRTPPPGGPGAPPAAPAAPGGPGVPTAPAGPPGGAQAVADDVMDPEAAWRDLPGAQAAPTGPGLSAAELDEALRQLRATGDPEAAELAAKLDTPAARAELTGAGLLSDGLETPSANEQAVMDLLQAAPRGVSPEALGAKLGVTRAELAEAVAKLEKRGAVAVDEAGRVRLADAADPVAELREAAPALAKQVEEHVAAVPEGAAKAKQWWDQLVEEPAPQPAAPFKTDLFEDVPSAERRAERARMVGTPPSHRPDVTPPHPYLAEPLGGQGGITAGGFFRGADGQLRYVKFADRDHQLNEMANTEMYRDFGIESIRFERVELPRDAVAKWDIQGQVGKILKQELNRPHDPVAIASVKVDGDQWKPVGDVPRQLRQDPKLVKEYLRGVPADLVIGNWDIAGNPGNVLVNVKTLQVMRLDAGEAGLNSFMPMRGLVRSEWENFSNALTRPGHKERPDSLLRGVPAAEAKQVLLEEFEKIEKVFDGAGGVRAYFEQKFPHVKPAKVHAHADQVAQNLVIAKQNAAALAVMALAVGDAVFGGAADDAGEPATAAAAPGAPGAGFAAAAGLFTRARTKLVANVARKLFSTLAEPTLRTTARLVYSREQLQARSAEIQSWTQDPNQLVARVAEGLRDAPPEVFASTSAAMFRTASFLRDRLPQAGRPAPVAAPRAATPVSADAAAKYARYEQAALEPGEALREAAETRYLTPELMETLEELYPDLLAELRVAAYQAIQDGGGVSSVQAKTQYARLFGGDGTLASPAFSPTATKAYAYAYEQSVAAEKPQAAPAGPRPGVSNTAAAVSPPRPWQTG
jgi:hypothetical protein